MVEKRNPLMQILNPLLVYASYLFLYLPVFVIAMFSFNQSRFSVKWTGFSLQWYKKVFSSPEILDALSVSLIVAVSSTIISVLIGACFVIAACRWNHSTKRWRAWATQAIFYPNIVLPDIAIAVGILSLFAFFKMPVGYGSLIAGHTLIGLGFVVPIIRARFVELDPFFTEASLDLGASTFQTYRKILFPLLRPSLIAAALIVFTLSLDDFLIAFFCTSPKIQTLSLYVYAQMKETIDPSINAISVLMLALSSAVALLLCAMKVIDKVIGNE